MARHNREGTGSDQCGFRYRVSYQPDWLKRVRVTRKLESERQSTKTLLWNPAPESEAEPGERVRTRVLSVDQSIDFAVALTDPAAAVRCIRVCYEIPVGDGRTEEVEFTLERQTDSDS